MKDKLKKKSFWLAVMGLVIMILQACGVKINVPVVNEAIAGVSGFLVMLGILVDDKKNSNESVENGEESVEESTVENVDCV